MKLPNKHFFFLRHGETAYNREGRFQGKIDVPLNSNGLSQANTVVDVLENCEFSRIISSPALRVRQTYAPFIDGNSIPVHIEDGLLEMSVGSFEGRLFTDVWRENGLENGESWLSVLPEDAELWHKFEERVCSAVVDWTDKFHSETLLIASHGLVFLALAKRMSGQIIHSGNAQIHFFRPTEESWSVTPVER